MTIILLQNNPNPETINTGSPLAFEDPFFEAGWSLFSMYSTRTNANNNAAKTR